MAKNNDWQELNNSIQELISVFKELRDTQEEAVTPPPSALDNIEIDTYVASSPLKVKNKSSDDKLFYDKALDETSKALGKVTGPLRKLESVFKEFSGLVDKLAVGLISESSAKIDNVYENPRQRARGLLTDMAAYGVNFSQKEQIEILNQFQSVSARQFQAGREFDRITRRGAFITSAFDNLLGTNMVDTFAGWRENIQDARFEYDPTMLEREATQAEILHRKKINNSRQVGRVNGIINRTDEYNEN